VYPATGTIAQVVVRCSGMTTSAADAPTRSHAELALGDTAEYVEKTLAKAPKLTEEQLGRLRDLFL
jgi:hypothetical protein